MTPAQAYLALHALPEMMIAPCRDRILSLLKDTAYLSEAREMLESS